MSTVSEKMKGQTAVTPHEIVETDHENIKLSKDAFIAKYRKKAEIKAKLKIEQARLEELAEQEEKELEKLGQEDNVQNEQKAIEE